MLLLYWDSLDGKDVDALDQGSRTCDIRAQNGTWKDFLGARHLLLSQILYIFHPDSVSYCEEYVCVHIFDSVDIGYEL
jgi:hypothetical protein